MTSYDFCGRVLEFEFLETNVSLNDKNYCADVAIDYENDNRPIKRISYLYKYGNFNITFFRHCFRKFSRAPNTLKIIREMCSIPNLNICSLSNGPGTHLLGFLSSLNDLGESLKGPVSFNFVNKHGTWRKTVKFMIDSAELKVPSSFKLIQCDIATEIHAKAQTCIKMADVLFLCHAFTSTIPNKNEQVLKNILQFLKPGSLVFLIFNGDYSSKFNELNANGNFLYGPTEITLMTEKIPTKLQVDPVNTGSALFSAWQKKKPTIPQKISCPATAIPTGETQKPVTGANINKSAATQNNSEIKDSRKLDSLVDGLKSESSNSTVSDSKSSFESLVKTLEGLVTNLEGMVRCHNTKNIGNSPNHHCGFECPCCKRMQVERSCCSRHHCNTCHHHNHFCIRKQANNCSITSNCCEHCMSTKHNCR